MSTREAYVEKYKAQIDLIDAEIARLEAKSRIAKADARIRADQELTALRQKRDAARAKLAEIGNSSAEAWTSLKEGAEDAWAALSSAVKSAAEKFK